MAASHKERYPHHLAKLVGQALAQRSLQPPSHRVLRKLFETLYFASLKTDEARLCRCTVNFLDSTAARNDFSPPTEEDRWTVTPFDKPIKLEVRSLLKLAEAADPAVSSLAIYSDANDDLFICGMVDQELRYGDRVALDANEDPQRPGLFQATINGVAAISVYKNFSLLGSLEQNNLITQYHDALWDGPIHQRLKQNLGTSLLDRLALIEIDSTPAQIEQLKDELLVRWLNAICRILYNIQKYGHGGGLLIVPAYPAPDLNIKYELAYRRLPKVLLQVSELQVSKHQIHSSISEQCRTPDAPLPYDSHLNSIRCMKELERLKNELLGCNRFIASLSRVDGFVLMDKSLAVHGFGVEARADDPIEEINVAGNATAVPRLMRSVKIDQFGTRHRAMMRYCNRHAESLGFVVSQDGDIRAIVKHRGQLILWENINVQLAYRVERHETAIAEFSSTAISGMLKDWMLPQSDLRSA
ncbi:MAG TPA: hypothetical protein VLA12_08130 [Planctomycetaceae bacterium]|nr:hypothetical protein [Planctomycetaceae bacterium]